MGGEVPQLHRPLFGFIWLETARPTALHEGPGRAMVMEVQT
jgi:hypothetical protein